MKGQNPRPLESRYYFPIARTTFLVVSSLLLLSCITSLGFASYRAMQASWLASEVDIEVRVEPEAVTRMVSPQLGRATPVRSARVFSEPKPPRERLIDRYPDADLPTLFRLLDPEATPDVLTDRVREALELAVEEGDTPTAYIANALECIQSQAEGSRLAAIGVFHVERMLLLRDAENERTSREFRSEQARVSRSQWITAGVVSFFAFLNVVLLLAILAIERNTRSGVSDSDRSGEPLAAGGSDWDDD